MTVKGCINGSVYCKAAGYTAEAERECQLYRGDDYNLVVLHVPGETSDHDITIDLDESELVAALAAAGIVVDAEE